MTQRSQGPKQSRALANSTAKTAILFIQPQYSITTLSPEGEVTTHHYGWKDCATILFYFFIAIILRAVVPEYLPDKVNRRLHLSKSKNTNFNESGQLCVFHLVSSVWSFYILVTEGYLLHPSSLWENYPQSQLRMMVLLLACLTQSWLLWKFIRFQLRHWREFRHQQAVHKKTVTKQPLRPLKRDT
ncbi:translocating chain-associated membrane protein 2-like [Odontesthes bonariensis]